MPLIRPHTLPPTLSPKTMINRLRPSQPPHLFASSRSERHAAAGALRFLRGPLVYLDGVTLVIT